MESFARHYPDWKAPSEDGKLLVWPAPEHLLRETLENHRRLSRAESARLQNVPLPELRRRMRQFVGHDDDLPLLATGHQTELHHPGVWVKNALINAAADKLAGQAFHISVDTDAPKHLSVRWPGESVPITDDPKLSEDQWSGLLAPPSPAHLDDIAARLAGASAEWDFQPMLGTVLSSLRRLSLESLDLPAALANAMHELDWSLGLRQHVLLASPIWSSEPCVVLAYALLGHADGVAAHYNAALKAYRDEHGIHSRSRPMPDLFAGDDAVEVPFWLDNLHTGQRTRPSVFKDSRGWIMELAGGELFIFEAAAEGWEAAGRLQRWLTATRHRIAPRALTLTTFFRLLMVDQFVHGIGGGRYDQVADRLIAGHFAIEPPAFAVTTATLYFPAALGRQRVCVPCVEQEGHRLKHALLGPRKRELVAQIASLPRKSAQRSSRFYQMHNELTAAAAHSEALHRWQERLREVQQRQKEEQTLFDRELFYALQSRERLTGMIEQYNKAFAGAET